MAKFKPIRIYESELNSFPISDGQVIITKDTFEQFLDVSSDNRIKITDIIKITEDQRKDMLAPVEHIYFTVDTKKLWEYSSDEWTVLNSHVLSESEIAEALGYVPASVSQIEELLAEINVLKHGIDMDGGNAFSNSNDYENDFDGGGA